MVAASMAAPLAAEKEIGARGVAAVLRAAGEAGLDAGECSWSDDKKGKDLHIEGAPLQVKASESASPRFNAGAGKTFGYYASSGILIVLVFNMGTEFGLVGYRSAVFDMPEIKCRNFEELRALLGDDYAPNGAALGVKLREAIAQGGVPGQAILKRTRGAFARAGIDRQFEELQPVKRRKRNSK